MESSNRPKRQRIHDRESENEHLRDLSDLSGFSEFDNSDTDEDLGILHTNKYFITNFLYL